MKNSSSTEHLSNDEHKCEGNKLVFNSIIGLPLCVPPLMNTPNPILFFKSPISSGTASNKPRIESLAKEANRVLENLHARIVSSRDKCVRFLDLFASQNPVLSKLYSLPSEYRKFCQTNCRNYRNLNSLSSHNFAAILPGDSVAGIVAANGVLNFLNIYNTLLVVRLVLTWFPNSPPAIVSPLSTICDPYLNIFRGIIPPLGGTLDLSPILAFLVLNALTSTASALPAELPSAQVSQKRQSSNTTLSHLTMCQKNWMKRFDRKSSKSPSSSNDF